MCAALLAFRIWSIERRTTHSIELVRSEDKLTPVVRIVLESGLINAAFLFVFVMTLAAGSSSYEIMSELVSSALRAASSTC